jgi:hypothetical protein
MITTLRYLSEQRFASFIRWLEGSGDGQGEAGVEATCIVMLQPPDVPRPKPYYAKFYHDLGGQSRALANEITGYVLADRFGLPQPPSACLAKVPLAKLDTRNLPKRHAWLKQAMKTHGYWPAFCTEAVTRPTPWQHYGPHAQELMKADIRKWPDHVKTLAFDEVIANLDRHFNNLLRIGDSRYALIDHGRLVVADGHWQAAQLDANLASTNRLLHLLYKDPTDVVNGMIFAAEGATILLAGLAEVDYWLAGVLTDRGEHQAFHNFLQARTIAAPNRIAARYALC